MPSTSAVLPTRSLAIPLLTNPKCWLLPFTTQSISQCCQLPFQNRPQVYPLLSICTTTRQSLQSLPGSKQPERPSKNTNQTMSFLYTGPSGVFSPHSGWNPNGRLCPIWYWAHPPVSEALKHTLPGVCFSYGSITFLLILFNLPEQRLQESHILICLVCHGICSTRTTSGI